jgi:hypothetical protein
MIILISNPFTEEWLGVMFGALFYMARTLRKLQWKYLVSFEMWCWMRMEKLKWSEKVTNEQVLERIGKKRTLPNNILRRKVNWICHILRRNCLLHDTIEGEMTEVKGVGRRRRIELLDDMRNKKILGAKGGS